MNTSHFDRLTAALTASGSRRTVAQILVALVLPGVATLDHASAADVQERRRARRRNRHQRRRHDRRKSNKGLGSGCSVLGSACTYNTDARAFICRGANLSGLVIPRDCNLGEADLSETNLTGVVMDGVDLQSAYFTDATMKDASLVGANLIMGLLRNVDLRNAKLTNADLRFANLQQADLTNASLSGTRWMRTTCPDGSSSDESATQTCCGHLNGVVVRDGC